MPLRRHGELVQDFGQRHSELVQDFGQRLAAKLGLPFVPVQRKRRETPPQKEMQNSSMQLRNLLKAFQVIEAPFSGPADSTSEAGGFTGVVRHFSRELTAKFGPGPILPNLPVLLVDDVVDSRWTITLAAILLQQHGSGPGYPFALARASLRGS